MFLITVGLLLAAQLKPVPLGNPVSIASDDYPPAALRREEEGVTSYRLDVSDAGLPVRCEIERSSGFADLDEKTCAIVMRRARFKPPVDRQGVAHSSTYAAKVTWKIHNISAASKSD